VGRWLVELDVMIYPHGSRSNIKRNLNNQIDFQEI